MIFFIKTYHLNLWFDFLFSFDLHYQYLIKIIFTLIYSYFAIFLTRVRNLESDQFSYSIFQIEARFPINLYLGFIIFDCGYRSNY